MNENNELPNVVMPHCPHRNLLRGQKALVTGASSGIGKSVAVYLAQEGADVVINFIGDKQAAHEVMETIRSNGGKPFPFKQMYLVKRRCKQCLHRCLITSAPSIFW